MKKKRILILSIVITTIIIICVVFTLNHSNSKYLSIKLNGKEKIELEYGEDYKDQGAKASYKKENLTKKIKIKTNINLKKIGEYYYKYTIKYKNITKSIKRTVIIKDTTKPEIKLNGDERINIYLDNDYNELGASATDNYDGDLTDKIKVEGSVDNKKQGEYIIKYSVADSSNNENTISRTVNVIKKEEKKVEQKSSKSTTSKGFKIEQINGIYYINGILIANKSYSLPSNYNPGGLLSEFQTNFDKMQSDAASEGINLKIISGFRSYNTQKNIYNNYVARDGQELADRYSARAGHSEHQSGLAADINSLDQSWEYTNEGKWLNQNCYKYGFIIRYVKGKESITGYMFEPWHIRYVGNDLANKLYNNGNWITLEEYFGIDSVYN
ncbi:MAG: DUF5011 domain-containing protein [Bacilli bacterium]|nr:DUF5011 domain-containing protein [Bacilli bacterium]